jgi:hypothetical protein
MMSDEYAGMTEDPLAFLKDHQQEIGLKLLLHTRWLAATRYGWQEGKTLPLGKDPEDIVCAVVDKFLKSDRRHFKAGHDIEIQLKRAVQSELWALHQRKEARALPLVDEQEVETPASYQATSPPPDAATASADDCECILRTLGEHPKVRGNEEMELLLLAFEDGAETSQELADAAGFPVTRVYELTRLLRKIYPSIKAKLNKGTEILK